MSKIHKIDLNRFPTPYPEGVYARGLEHISPDGKYGYVVSWRKELQIVDSKTGTYRCESSTDGFLKDIAVVAPGGKRVVGISLDHDYSDGELLIFDGKSAVLLGHSMTRNQVQTVECISPDGAFILTEGGYHYHYIINGKTARTVNHFSASEYRTVRPLALSQDGKKLFLEDWFENEIRLFDTKTYATLAQSETKGKIDNVKVLFSNDLSKIFVYDKDICISDKDYEGRTPRFILNGQNLKSA